MRSTAKQRVLDALKTAGTRGATTAELCQPSVGGARFGGRIHDLSQEGWKIDATYERPGSYRYRLLNNVMSGAGASTAIPERGAAVTGVEPVLALGIADDKQGAQCAIFDDWEDAA